MQKVKNRTMSILFIVAVLVVGLVVYISKYLADGAEWAAFPSDDAVYCDGVLAVGTLTDRDGDLLAMMDSDGIHYAEDSDVRRAALHATGDAEGNIGSGAIYVFTDELIGYDPVMGVYSSDGRGGSVKLSIDDELNVTAMRALDGRRGTVAVADCVTGELLCMVSSPNFDPADVPDDLDSDKYEGVYLNRFISAAYTPGSVFKLVTLAAAIENIDDLNDRTFTCEGSLPVGDGYVTCTGVHGELTIEEALAESCNCAFAQLSLELGGETIAVYAEKYGLTTSWSLDGVSTAAGMFEMAKNNELNLAWSGIGQYNDTVNPFSMLRFVAAIANGGDTPEFTLLKREKIAPSSRIMSAETAGAISDMMNYNVHRTYGTDNFPGLTMYAKSGTAETGAVTQPHAWFVGYAEKDGRKLAFVVIVENGGWGSRTAGSIANTVLQKAFETDK